MLKNNMLMIDYSIFSLELSFIRFGNKDINTYINLGTTNMKLNEMNTTATPKKLNKVMESRFGFTIDYDTLTVEKAQRLTKALGENIERIRRSYGVHTAEKNPKYMELLLVKEGLTKWMSNYRHLVEGEMGKSEAILAAKDIVDTLQDTLEKISKIQNEQLPALLDTVRDQIGAAQADQFKNTITPLLQQLSQQLSDGRGQADNAARALAGEQVDQPMGMGGMDPMGGAEMGPDLTGASDLDSDMGDGFGAVDAAAGGEEELGRQRRGMAESKKAKPDFKDVDGDKNKKESWKKAEKDKAAKKK
jgi:hypothetical protein